MKRHLRITGLLIFLISLLPVSPGFPPQPVLGQETETSGAEEPDYPDMEADFIITTYDPSGHVGKTKTRVIRIGNRIRYQGGENLNEDWIIDYKNMQEFRIYPKDKIYFIKPIGKTFREKAALEGFFPFQPFTEDFEINRIPIRKETIDGHPSEFIVVTQTHKEDEFVGQASIFVWQAMDLKQQPLKIAYYERNSTLKVLEYKNIQTGSVDETLLDPPEDFMSMTPY